MTTETHEQEAQAVFQMTQDLHWNTPLVIRSRADIARYFDGFTLVEPGLVTPAQWRPDLHNPLLIPGRTMTTRLCSSWSYRSPPAAHGTCAVPSGACWRSVRLPAG